MKLKGIKIEIFIDEVSIPCNEELQGIDVKKIAEGLCRYQFSSLNNVEDNISSKKVEKMMCKNTNAIKVVETNLLNTYSVGSMVKNQSLGRGVVVGYSSLSGNPFVFFYGNETTLCISADDVTPD